MGDTTYCVSIIPFGGYVKMFGDEAHVEVPLEEQKYSFNHQRFFLVLRLFLRVL